MRQSRFFLVSRVNSFCTDNTVSFSTSFISFLKHLCLTFFFVSADATAQGQVNLDGVVHGRGARAAVQARQRPLPPRLARHVRRQARLPGLQGRAQGPRLYDGQVREEKVLRRPGARGCRRAAAAAVHAARRGGH